MGGGLHPGRRVAGGGSSARGSSTELLLVPRRTMTMRSGILLTGLGWFGAAAHWHFSFFFYFFSFFSVFSFLSF
jgi:hypothetical protein